jgi:hypothetical protein
MIAYININLSRNTIVYSNQSVERSINQSEEKKRKKKNKPSRPAASVARASPVRRARTRNNNAAGRSLALTSPLAEDYWLVAPTLLGWLDGLFLPSSFSLLLSSHFIS